MLTTTLIDPMANSDWDNFVEAHPNGSFVHLAAWKKTLEASFPHLQGHFIAVLDPDRNILAGLPIYEVKSALMGNRLVSVPFASLSEPLALDSGEMILLLNAARDLAARRNISGIEIRLRQADFPLQDIAWKTRVNYQIHYLNLNSRPEELFKTFHRTCIQNRIKHAVKQGFSASVAGEENEWRLFYQIYQQQRKNSGLPAQPYLFFQSLFLNFAPKDMARLFLLKLDGTFVGGLLVFLFKNKMTAEVLATVNAYKSHGVDQFLYWQAIVVACELGFTEFNFGRTHIANTSLSTFKRRWATEVGNLPELFFASKHEPVSYQSTDSISYKLARSVLKYSPTFAYSLFGDLLYRHMG